MPEQESHLDGEVHVAGRVDDVDVGVLPLAVGCRRLDGDAFLSLQIHAVHLGADAIFAAHLPHSQSRFDAQFASVKTVS